MVTNQLAELIPTTGTSWRD